MVDDLLLKVFNLLKDSGLINEIIRMSLTDPLVRRSLTDVTARLLKARVVPWDDIFIALRRHGLAFEVVEFTLTNAETRAGLASFVVELLPRLVNAGSITPGQLLDTIPRIQEEVDSRKSQKGLLILIILILIKRVVLLMVLKIFQALSSKSHMKWWFLIRLKVQI